MKRLLLYNLAVAAGFFFIYALSWKLSDSLATALDLIVLFLCCPCFYASSYAALRRGNMSVAPAAAFSVVVSVPSAFLLLAVEFYSARFFDPWY